MNKLRMGILGAGRIAAKMADTVAKMDSAVVCAVASRDEDRARAFASRHGVKKAFSSYEAMLDDPEVELAYVATPNNLHLEHMRLGLERGKHILCEKPFAIDARQAGEAIELAEKKNLLLAEAIWTRYLPFCGTIRKLLSDGIIGEPSGLIASLGNNVQEWQRINDPALGGGALMDLGVYLLNFAAMFFGTEVERIAAECLKHPSGVDLQTSLTLCYQSGKMAVLHATTQAGASHRAAIYGDKGYLEVEKLNNPQSIRVFSPDRVPGEIFRCPPQITGFEYQVEAAASAIRAGRTECPEMPHSEILAIMRLMDAFRARLGIPLPWEVCPASSRN
ncbi:MAG: Gfo/Idh/MocA family oxidoreductase [Planctomycetota bacterium]|jgi:predicted dehydrogenase|nr:Gfo/Idh/MocA family oxidoreductase [Planctomycetota bacterium]